MNTAKEHYDRQLAGIYTWMTGDFEAVIERNRAFFRQFEMDKLSRGRAIDLGAGPGFQSIPLAELGFSVVAVDFSSELLTELQMRAENLPIHTVQDDILNFCEHYDEKAEIIVCMGDTLTHLKSLDDVEELLRNAARLLSKSGIIALTFRDYVSAELYGTQRFIPVQADESKIFSCFLEFHKDFVEVFDLVYSREEGQWKLDISSYPKLRLNGDWIENQLLKNKLIVVQNERADGIIKVIARNSQ